MKINYDELDEMYESAPLRGLMRKSTEPVGSLTTTAER